MTSDVLVIGAGIIGLACADRFARAGAKVTILEQYHPGAGQTTRTGGGIRLAHGSELHIQLSLRSYDHWLNFYERFGVDPGYVETGHLFFTSLDAPNSNFKAHSDLQRAFNLPSRTLSEAEVHSEWPQLNKVTADHAIFCQAGGYLDHHRVVDGYVRELLRMGVKIESGRRVDNLIFDKGRVVGAKTTQGAYTAETIINAAGPYAGRFCEDVGKPEYFVSRRHMLLIVRPDAPIPSETPWLIDTDAQVHLRPDGEGCALIGGFLGADEASEPQNFQAAYDTNWADRVREAACFAFGLTGPKVEIVDGWAGLYPGTQDYLPIVEHTCPGLLTVAGMSGTGLMHAPAIAEIAWDLHNGIETTWIDRTQLSVARFKRSSGIVETTGF